jgi:hypothetical protein
MPELKMDIDPRLGKRFHIKCCSKYFALKYGEDPLIELTEVFEEARNLGFNPPTFLYQGRVLAEGKKGLLHGKIYYGHVNGIGEFIHESELGEIVAK